MMQDAGQSTQGLLFLPKVTSPFLIAEQVVCANEVAADLVQASEITAVVAMNVQAASGLIHALRAANIAPERWPTILCFDYAPEGVGSVVSYMRLPWEKIGAESAQLLWERRTGRLTGPQQKRLIKMHLIPCLTYQPSWANPKAVRMWARWYRSSLDTSNFATNATVTVACCSSFQPLKNAIEENHVYISFPFLP